MPVAGPAASDRAWLQRWRDADAAVALDPSPLQEAALALWDTDDWLLLRQHSPLAAHGRCFGRGDILTAEGALVASYAQEALLRL